MIKIDKIIQIFTLFSVLSLGFFLSFSPISVHAAGDYGDMIIKTQAKYANRTVDLSGVTVTVSDGGSGHTYSGSCGNSDHQPSTKKCSKAGMVNLATKPDTCLSSISKKSSEGQVKWTNTFSACHCTFSIRLSTPSVSSATGNNDYEWRGGWSPVEPIAVGSFGNDGTYKKTFTMTAVLKRKTLTVKVDPPEAATPTGSGSYNIHSLAKAGYEKQDSAYQFDGWSDGCTGASNPTRVNMDTNKTCTAKFSKITSPGPTPIMGCTNKTASNYNPSATVDDGSCVFPNPNIDSSVSCTVTPASGESPLVVKIHTASLSSGPFQYKMDSGKTDELLQSSKPADFWYTYSKAGIYTIKVNLQNNPLPTWVTCTAISTGATQITVTDPGSQNGGEVSR